eukprot:231456-Rhodomonas_salina.1
MAGGRGHSSGRRTKKTARHQYTLDCFTWHIANENKFPQVHACPVRAYRKIVPLRRYPEAPRHCYGAGSC